MMVNDPDEALQRIRALTLPAVFVDVWTSSIPEIIQDDCCRPERFFDILEELDRHYSRLSRFVPLWEENLDAIVGLDEATGEYLRLHYSADLGEELLGTSYQRFVTSFFLELIDSGVWEEMEQLSSVFSYKHLAELRLFSENTVGETYEEDRRRLLSSID